MPRLAWVRRLVMSCHLSRVTYALECRYWHPLELLEHAAIQNVQVNSQTLLRQTPPHKLHLYYIGWHHYQCTAHLSYHQYHDVSADALRVSLFGPPWVGYRALKYCSNTFGGYQYTKKRVQLTKTSKIYGTRDFRIVTLQYQPGDTCVTKSERKASRAFMFILP